MKTFLFENAGMYDKYKAHADIYFTEKRLQANYRKNRQLDFPRHFNLYLC